MSCDGQVGGVSCGATGSIDSVECCEYESVPDEQERLHDMVYYLPTDEEGGLWFIVIGPTPPGPGPSGDMGVQITPAPFTPPPSDSPPVPPTINPGPIIPGGPFVPPPGDIGPIITPAPFNPPGPDVIPTGGGDAGDRDGLPAPPSDW